MGVVILVLGLGMFYASVRYIYLLWFRPDKYRISIEELKLDHESEMYRWATSKLAFWTGRIGVLVMLPGSGLFILLGLGTIYVDWFK